MKHYILLVILLTIKSLGFSQNEIAEKSKQGQITVTESIPENDIIVPDGFSPNGDGIHDVFEVKGLKKKYPNFKMEIFNSGGDSLWEYKHNDNPNSAPEWWDGKVHGNYVKKGIYSYAIDFNDGSTKKKSGDFILAK